VLYIYIKNTIYRDGFPHVYMQNSCSVNTLPCSLLTYANFLNLMTSSMYVSDTPSWKSGPVYLQGKGTMGTQQHVLNTTPQQPHSLDDDWQTSPTDVSKPCCLCSALQSLQQSAQAPLPTPHGPKAHSTVPNSARAMQSPLLFESRSAKTRPPWEGPQSHSHGYSHDVASEHVV
jgi:hypothetical protein